MKYKIIKYLDSGCYGDIYLIHFNNQECILKKINLQKVELNEALNEVKIMQKINHPNIIKYYNHFINEESLDIIMEYASNGNIQNKYIYKNISNKQIYLFLQQLINAIKYLHSLKIVHGDIKPSNLLLDKNNNLKIADFGCSKQINYPINYLIGTPIYMSPELINHNQYYCKNDIWAIGIILYQLIYHKLPYQPSNLFHLIYLINNLKLKNNTHFYSFILSKMLSNNRWTALRLSNYLNNNQQDLYL